MTVAMWYAREGDLDEIPKEWYHRPDLKNHLNYTVAM